MQIPRDSSTGGQVRGATGSDLFHCTPVALPRLESKKRLGPAHPAVWALEAASSKMRLYIPFLAAPFGKA